MVKPVAPLLGPELTLEQRNKNVGTILRTIIDKSDCSEYKMEREHGVHVTHSITNAQSLTRRSVHAALELVKASPETVEMVRKAFIGRDPATTQEHIQAHACWRGYEDLVALSGFSMSTIHEFFHGKKRKTCKETPPKFPTLMQWRKLAPAFGFTDEKVAYTYWRQDALRYFRNERHLNPLATEIHILWNEFEVSSNDWLKWSHDQRPVAFQNLNRRRLSAMLRNLRAGKIIPMQELEVFSDALSLTAVHRKRLQRAVWETVMENEPKFKPFLDSPAFQEWKEKAIQKIRNAYLQSAELEPVVLQILERGPYVSASASAKLQVSHTQEKKLPVVDSISASSSFNEVGAWVKAKLGKILFLTYVQYGSVYCEIQDACRQGKDPLQAARSKLTALKKKHIGRLVSDEE